MATPVLLSAADVGHWVMVQIEGRRSTVMRLITRYSEAKKRFYARASDDGPERILPESVRVLKRFDRATSVSSPLLTAAAAATGAAAGSGPFKRPREYEASSVPEVAIAGRRPMIRHHFRSDAVLPPANSSPIAWLGRTLSAHVTGGTPLERQYRSTVHGLELTVRCVELADGAPRVLEIVQLEMPEDAWNRNIGGMFLEGIVLPVMPHGNVGVVAINTRGNPRLKAWCDTHQGKLAEAARVRRASDPNPDWQFLADGAYRDAWYILLRRGVSAGLLAVWLHDRRSMLA